MGKGRRVREQRRTAATTTEVAQVVGELAQSMRRPKPSTVREALTDGEQVRTPFPVAAVRQAEALGETLTRRGWTFAPGLCGIGGQLGWRYPPSRMPATDDEVWEVSNITVDVDPHPDSRGGYIDSGAAYLALVGADPYADAAWTIPVTELPDHLDVIEAHRAGAGDPLPQYRVLDDA